MGVNVDLVHIPLCLRVHNHTPNLGGPVERMHCFRQLMSRQGLLTLKRRLRRLTFLVLVPVLVALLNVTTNMRSASSQATTRQSIHT